MSTYRVRSSASSQSLLFVCGALAIFLLGPTAEGQTSATGALTVTVLDPSAASLPGATVVIGNTAGLSRTDTTGSNGSYTFTLLPPGSYKVAISAPGFKPVEVPAVTVDVAETRALTQTLQVGEQQQQITVQAEAHAVQTETSTLGGVVGGNLIASLPLVTRNYTQILSLAPGVVSNVFNGAALGRGSLDINVNGNTNVSNDFQMDGISVTNSVSGQTTSLNGFYGDIPIPNPDALQEFKVQTANFDAGYGRKSGGNVNIITKSGTNDLHGSLFEYLRNDVLNANGFFQNRIGLARGELRQNQFGGTVGGPIKKDKLFFFGSYQGTRQLNGIDTTGFQTVSLPPQLGNVRTPAALGAAFCPANNPSGNPGAKYATTFAGGVQVACDGSNINPVALTILNAKMPNGSYYVNAPQTILNAGTASAVGSSSFSAPAAFNENQALGNLDYVVSSKHSLAAKYFYANGPQNRSFNNNPCLPGCGAGIISRNHLTSVKLTSLLTNNLVNEARASYYYIGAGTVSKDPFTLQQLGITGVALNNWISVPPTITVNGLFAFGGAQTDGAKSPQSNYEWSDQISWSHGRHSIRMGYDGRYLAWDFNVYWQTRGSMVFQTFADFLLGESGAQNGTNFSNVYSSSASQQPIGGLLAPLRGWAHSAFVQDDIKVNRRLTVNVGLRWEYDGNYWAASGQMFDAWWSLAQQVPIPPATGTFAGFTVASNYPGNPPNGLFRRPGKDQTQNGAPLDDFGPRLGFAWQPLGTDKLVVRGGAGIFYDQNSGNPYVNPIVANPPLSTPEGFSGTNNILATFQVPFTANRALGFDTSVRTTTSALSASGMDQFLVTPKQFSYSLNVQYEFRPSWILDIASVNQRGLHLLAVRNFNIPQLATATGSLNCGVFSTLISSTNPNGCVVTNTSANAIQRVPVVGYAAGGFSQDGDFGDSEYNALQVALRHSFSHGLQLQGAYSYGRVFTDMTGVEFHGSGGTLTSNDPANFAQQHGAADFNRPHRFILNYAYSLPAYHDGKGLAGKALAGWGLAGVTTVQSGLPMTLTDPTGGAVYGFAGASRAQLCPGMTYANLVNPGGVESKLGSYFNLNAVADTVVTGATPAAKAACPFPILGAFASPGAGAPASTGATGYGNMGRSILFGPGQVNWDMSIRKHTRVGGLREDADLELRADFFNAFNHAQFSNPATNVNAGSFGVINSTVVGPRIIQLGIKYLF